jgi:hypothetical protein
MPEGFLDRQPEATGPVAVRRAFMGVPQKACDGNAASKKHV